MIIRIVGQETGKEATVICQLDIILGNLFIFFIPNFFIIFIFTFFIRFKEDQMDEQGVRVIGVDFDTYLSQWGNSCPKESFKTTLKERSTEILSKLKEPNANRPKNSPPHFILSNKRFIFPYSITTYVGQWSKRYIKLYITRYENNLTKIAFYCSNRSSTLSSSSQTMLISFLYNFDFLELGLHMFI